MPAQIKSLKNIFNGLFAKLMAFTLRKDFLNDLGESLEIFYNLQAGEEYEFDPTEEFLFLGWFLLDDCDAEGKSLMDEFMKVYADELSLQEMQLCAALKDTSLALLQVKTIKSGISIHLKDVFLGEEFDVLESVSNDIMVDNILFTRVLHLGEAVFLVGAGIFLDHSVMQPLTSFVTDQYKLECEDGYHVSFKDFLKNSGELINWWIRAYSKGELLQDSDPEEDDDDSPTSNPETDSKDTPKPDKDPKPLTTT